jgi:hypothetical protein
MPPGVSSWALAPGSGVPLLVKTRPLMDRDCRGRVDR